MRLSILLSFLVLFVIWAETNGAPDQDIYKLETWTRDPKYERNRKSNIRSARLMRTVKPRNKKDGFVDENLNPVSPIRRVRKPLKERIHERVHAGEKDRRHESKKSEDKKEDEDHEHKSTRITPMQLVEQTSTGVPGKKDKNVVKSDEDDKKNDKPLHDAKDEEDHEASLEQLSVYSMKQTMNEIAKQLGKETNITLEVLGRTFEYNDIVLLKMTEIKSEISKYFRSNANDKYIDDVPEKKIIFIVHGLVTMGIHGVPCLSHNKRFMQLLNYYLEHLDKFDIFLIPIGNPDGFAKTVYTLTWNKNVSPQTSCQGVNLDRNFDVAWAESGQVSSCSQHYPGPSAFSEPETRAVRDVLHRYSHKIAAYIHVHGGTFLDFTFKGEAVLYPKGFTEAQSDDDKYMDLKGELDEIMRNASFQRATVAVDTLHRWYGKVTGTSVDYASTVFGIPFAMEFVMQSYSISLFQDAALSAIWKRVIDAVFTFIHKKGETTNDI